MSVVACRITNDGYEIAADSISVRGWTQNKGDTKNLSKLFEINGIVIGCVGVAQEVGLLRIFLYTHKPSSPNEQSILEFLSEFSDWKRNKIDDSYGIENSYLIGFNNKVFAVENFLIEQVISYEAIGAGMDFALAALYLGHSPEKAVETAIELSVMCEGPVKVIKKYG